MNSTYLFRNVCITDPGSPFHLQVKSILVQDGIIQQIDDQIEVKNAVTIDCSNHFIGPGFFDIGTQVGDPGLEQHENFESACKAALAGGFTGMAVLPNSAPVVDSKSMVDYITNQNKNNAVDIYPIGAITQKCHGEQLAEIYDMKQAGAIAFSDGLKGVQHEGILLRALQYVTAFNGLILQHPEVKAISASGVMNEGQTSVSLGLKGIPALAEFAAIQRDIELCLYANSRLHFFNCTTTEGWNRIAAARANNGAISAGLASYYLLYTDEQLKEFESCYKVNPPLRSMQEVKALQDLVLSDTIEIICSWHQPQDFDHKNVEFSYANYGMVHLETCFSALNTALANRITPTQLVEKLAINPRKLLSIEVPTITVNAKANFTVFNTSENWQVQNDKIQSQSQNTPFIGKTLLGKIKGAFNKGSWNNNPH